MFEKKEEKLNNFLGYSTPDAYGWKIDYQVFFAYSDKKNAPTIMIIDGGPISLVQKEEHEENIEFFCNHGYNVILPQGLFRLGYPADHFLYSQGQEGEGDIHQLRCVLKDVRQRKITDEPVVVMGHSYGGYATAMLAYDTDNLVKKAICLAPACKITASNEYFVNRARESDEDRRDRLNSLSPSVDAPLPTVPIFVQVALNDFRCPIAKNLGFQARLLMESTHPFVWLTTESGGHNSALLLDPVLKFIKGEEGVPTPEGGAVVQRGMAFFK